MKKDYKALLSEKQFLKVQQRAMQLSGVHITAILYKDNEIVFETVSGTDHKTKWTQRIQVADLEGIDLEKLNYNKLTKLIKQSRLKVHCNCVDPSTVIRTNRGDIPIREVSRDDEVLSSDGKYYKVQSVLQSNRLQMYEVLIEDGSKLILSGEHEVRVMVFRRATKVKASELQPGMTVLGLRVNFTGSLRASDYKTSRITSVRLIEGKTQVYDISLLNGPHDYHANGWIISNCPAFLYWGFAYKAYKKGYGLKVEKRRPTIRNPHMRGFVCKHLYKVLMSYPAWCKEFARKFKEWDKKNKKNSK